MLADYPTMAGKLLTIAVIGVVLLFLLVPGVRRLGTRAFTTSEQITLPGGFSTEPSGAAGRSAELVTLLGFDAIPAILRPEFVTAPEAEAWMDPDERVLGLSVDGEHRAYSIKMLSRHEIVNDVVGGVPVAVTW